MERGLARQLSRPEGLPGRVVARRLNRFNAGIVGEAVQATQVGMGARVADVGFGGGVGLAQLLKRVGPHGHVDGVELSVTMLAAARRRYADECARGRLHLHGGSITSLPLADDSLDAVITVNTVYFVERLDLACAELARVLTPTGRAVIGIGDPDQMATLPFTAHGFRIRPVGEVAGALEEAGLTVNIVQVGHDDLLRHLLVGHRARTSRAASVADEQEDPTGA